MRFRRTLTVSAIIRTRMINHLRNTNPAKMKELTISHLSYVLDLSGVDQLEPFLNAPCSALETPVRVGSTAIMSTESRMSMINHVRNTNPAKLKELMISHLSYVLDMSGVDYQLEPFHNAPC